jgi:protein-S-isoprenylcysteine O-methyltransferase Ste14
LGWSSPPAVVSVAGDVLVGAGLLIAMISTIQNGYAAANINVESGQNVVSTGMYSVVRHPMYFGNVVLMLGVPLALGSYWALLFVIPGMAVLSIRILDEEKVLASELTGYSEYTQRVHYRLVPGVW